MPFEKHTGPDSDRRWRSHSFCSSTKLMMCPRRASPVLSPQEPFQAADMNVKDEIPYLHSPRLKGLGESESLLPQANKSVGKLTTGNHTIPKQVPSTLLTEHPKGNLPDNNSYTLLNCPKSIHPSLLLA